MDPSLEPVLTLGRALTRQAHVLIALCGALGVLSILAGFAARYVGAPVVLLVFLGLGMAVGPQGLGLHLADPSDAYAVGSVALAVILFEGGLKTSPATVRLVLWPALLMATVGVVVTAAVLGGFLAFVIGVPLAGAMLVASIVAPTDAGAVGALLRRARVALPERLSGLLEVESGLNDPMSVFLTILLTRLTIEPHLGAASALVLLVKEMGGGVLLGLAAGRAIAWLLHRLDLEPALAAVLVLAGGLALFGGSELVGASGFMAVYIAGVLTGADRHQGGAAIGRFIEALSWLAQIVLFVMLGLLVDPAALGGVLGVGLLAAAVLMLVARPVATVLCLAPFGFGVREIAFASWTGLRGAVPIYLSVIPAVVYPAQGQRLFEGVFVLVVASLVVQGWTIGAAARVLGFRDKNVLS